MTYTKKQQDVEYLVSLVLKEIDGDLSLPTLIHAGHFSLTVRDGVAVDNLDEPHECSPAAQEIVDFASVTWQAACNLVSRFPVGTAQIMTLVNDWQLLKFPSDSQRGRERLAARARDEYYRQTPKLPTLLLSMLKQHELTSQAILQSRDEQWLFSENELRSRLSATVSALLEDSRKSSSLGLEQYFTSSGDPIIDIADEDGSKFCLVYCGNTNCAGEFLQLLGDLRERGIRRFINLYPIQCRQPVLTGTDLAHRIFDLSNMDVINVALSAGSFHESHVHIDRLQIA